MHLYVRRSGKEYRLKKAFDNQEGYVWWLMPLKIIARWNKKHPILGRIHIQYEAEHTSDKRAWFTF